MTAQLPSKVRLAQIASFSKSMALPPSHDEIEAMARAILAAHEQEPVAYMCDGDDGREYNGHNEFSCGGRGVPLYAHPAPSIPAAITGDGIKASLSLTKIQIDWICNTCASIYHTSNDDVAQGYIDEIRATLERLTSILAVPDNWKGQLTGTQCTPKSVSQVSTGTSVGAVSAHAVPDYRESFEHWWCNYADEPKGYVEGQRTSMGGYYNEFIDRAWHSWNACRSAMLNGGKS